MPEQKTFSGGSAIYQKMGDSRKADGVSPVKDLKSLLKWA
jgi:hypothetical protein